MFTEAMMMIPWGEPPQDIQAEPQSPNCAVGPSVTLDVNLAISPNQQKQKTNKILTNRYNNYRHSASPELL
jgi:hypothetical protein